MFENGGRDETICVSLPQFLPGKTLLLQDGAGSADTKLSKLNRISQWPILPFRRADPPIHRAVQPCHVDVHLCQTPLHQPSRHSTECLAG